MQKLFLRWGHIFAKPKHRIVKEQRKDAIYSIPRNDCNQDYIGQTKRRQFPKRLNSIKNRFSFHKINSCFVGARMPR